MNPAILFYGELEKNIRPKLDRFAKSDFPIMILGETGTGKDVCARYIHHHSLRISGPLVTVNCASVPKDLAESLFFGSEAGAYTGSIKKTQGYFAQAQGGTLFLDEIGELPLEVQTKLLRVVEDGKVPILGAPRQLDVNVRLVVATNRDLKELCQKGLFRVDLFYRLSILQIYLPPLRERRDEISSLATIFLQKTGKKISPALMALLKEFRWPGNIRQLKHGLERASILCDKEVIDVGDFEFETYLGKTPGKKLISEKGEYFSDFYPLSMLDMEKAHILNMLRLHAWNKYRTAKVLQISPSTLHYKIKDYNLNRFQPRNIYEEVST